MGNAVAAGSGADLGLAAALATLRIACVEIEADTAVVRLGPFVFRVVRGPDGPASWTAFREERFGASDDDVRKAAEGVEKVRRLVRDVATSTDVRGFQRRFDEVL